MSTMTQAISSAVRVRAAREGLTLTAIAEKAGIKKTAFGDRMAGRRSWTTEELSGLANALNLPSSWDLFDLAKHEAELIDQEHTDLQATA